MFVCTVRPNKKRLLVSRPNPSKKGGRRVVLFLVFVIFFISLWMASNPFIGHIMGTKVLKPLTALIWLLKYVF